MKTITVLGLGNMGKPIYKHLSLCKNFVVKGCDKKDDINKCLSNSDGLIVAIKPQDFGKICKTITIDLSDKVIISIMAGISLSNLKKGLKCSKVVRAMPNLALEVESSFTGWIADKNLSKGEKESVKMIFELLGTEMELKDEKLLDTVTTIAGCGPAYFYKVCELMEEEAVKKGFTSKQAKVMVQQTLLGASKVWNKSEKPSNTMRNNVTSKGGVTEAAIDTMKKEGLDKAFKKGLSAANQKLNQLNR